MLFILKKTIMTTLNKLIKTRFFIPVLFTGILFSSCKKFVELGPPPTQTVLSDVFKSDATATSAILALYSQGSYGLTGMVLNFSTFPGMSADDVQYNTASALFAARPSAIDLPVLRCSRAANCG